MNKIIIMGHVGQDPEQRFTPGGKKVTNFNIAVNVKEAGEDKTIWYRVAVWGDTFDNLMQYIKKGSAVIVTGSLRAPTTWVDKNGNTNVSLEINADSLEFPRIGKGEKSEEGGRPAARQQPAAAAAPSYGTAESKGFGAGADEDLPF